jgi:hypothetical protein
MKLKIKNSLIKCDIWFLKRCLRDKVVPRFIQNSIKSNHKTPLVNKVISDSRRKLMTHEIRGHYKRLEYIGRELYSLHMSLTKSMDEHEWRVRCEKVDYVIKQKIVKKKRRLNWKFGGLMREQKSSSRVIEEDIRRKYIIYKSETKLSEEEEKVIANSLKYQPVPQEPPINELIASVETALKFLPNDVKTCIRNEIADILEDENNLKTRHIKGESKIITNLKKSELFFLQPDKGKGTVVIEEKDYREAAVAHLSSGPYERKTIKCKFPVDSLQRKVKSGLRALIRKGLLSESESRRLTVDNPVIPEFYCFPKIHKTGNKIRPVVSNVNSPTSKISEHLVKKFRKFKPPDSMSVKNSFEMAKKFNGMPIEDHECLISFDIESLFPSIPIEEAFELCKGWIASQDISDEEAELCVDLMSIVLDQRVFEYDGKQYTQKEGLFIGNNLSSIITEVFLGDIEMRYKDEPWWPRNWTRYVDDTAGFVNKEEVELITRNLNEIHPAIKFTCEVENENSLPFLDTLLIRENKKIAIDIFRKPTDNPLCIPQTSNHPLSHKLATFESSMFRLWNLPLSDERREKEFGYIKEMARINGYKTAIVEKMHQKHRDRHKIREITTLQPLEREKKIKESLGRNGKSFRHFAVIPFCNPVSYKVEKILRKYDVNVCYSNRGKLKNILNCGKRMLNENESAGVYEICCRKCSKKYIGQTKRRSETRDKEHSAAIKSRQIEKSSVAKHCWEEGHVRGEMKLLKRINEQPKLDAYESMYIAKTDDLMNTGEPPIVSKLFSYAII